MPSFSGQLPAWLRNDWHFWFWRSGVLRVLECVVCHTICGSQLIPFGCSAVLQTRGMRVVTDFSVAWFEGGVVETPEFGTRISSVAINWLCDHRFSLG